MSLHFVSNVSLHVFSYIFLIIDSLIKSFLGQSPNTGGGSANLQKKQHKQSKAILFVNNDSLF